MPQWRHTIKGDHTFVTLVYREQETSIENITERGGSHFSDAMVEVFSEKKLSTVKEAVT